MSAIIARSRVRNRLPATLASDDFSVLQPHLEHRSLDQGFIVEVPGEAIGAVYFPSRASSPW